MRTTQNLFSRSSISLIEIGSVPGNRIMPYAPGKADAKICAVLLAS